MILFQSTCTCLDSFPKNNSQELMEPFFLESQLVVKTY